MRWILIAFLLASSAPVNAELLGDLDRDGDVDFADFLIFAGNFGKTEAPPVETNSSLAGTYELLYENVTLANRADTIRLRHEPPEEHRLMVVSETTIVIATYYKTRPESNDYLRFGAYRAFAEFYTFLVFGDSLKTILLYPDGGGFKSQNYFNYHYAVMDSMGFQVLKLHWLKVEPPPYEGYSESLSAWKKSDK